MKKALQKLKSLCAAVRKITISDMPLKSVKLNEKRNARFGIIDPGNSIDTYDWASGGNKNPVPPLGDICFEGVSGYPSTKAVGGFQFFLAVHLNSYAVNL